MTSAQKALLAPWAARLAVGFVFTVNVACALAFILQPEHYTWGFEVSGVPGRTIVQGFGILFLMWNATYPPVLLNPSAQRTVFTIVLVQQLIGLVGEAWLYLQLPEGHAALRKTGLRFILFDGAGLLLMGAAYLWLYRSVWRSAQLPAGSTR
jgi:hypothetical protein